MAPKQIRPIRVEGNVAYVPLTQGYEAIIDTADVPLIAGRSWQAIVAGRSVYAHASVVMPNGKKTTIRMHRVLVGSPPGMDVDHKDANGLNNRRRGETGNLRLATRSQNAQNQRIHKDSGSGLKGVTWNKGNRRWQAQIMVKGKRHHLGYHDAPQDAHAAYVSASARLHGEFGRLD